MAADAYHANSPGDQQFLPPAGTVNKDSSKRQGNKAFLTSTTITAKYHPNAPGDQNFA